MLITQYLTLTRALLVSRPNRRGKRDKARGYHMGEGHWEAGSRGDWVAQLPRRCSRWLIDLGCGMEMAAEILLQERHPKHWTFKSDAVPTAQEKGAAWLTSQRRLRFARVLAAGFSTRGVCIAGLDGNPFFQEPLRKRAAEFAARGHPAVFVIPSVISAADGNATLMLDTKTISKNFWGSSLFKNRFVTSASTNQPQAF